MKINNNHAEPNNAMRTMINVLSLGDEQDNIGLINRF